MDKKPLLRIENKRYQLWFFSLLFGEVGAFQAGCRDCALGDRSAGLRL